MPTWYHRASWAALKALYSGSSLKAVSAAGALLLPERSFLLMADHANALDAYAIGSFSKTPIRYMANIEGVHPAKAFFAGLVGAYGRRKGSSDIAALRKTMSLARSGEAIGIFPEGDRSWDGASAPIRPGAGRLAKKLAEAYGFSLVLARQRGNYLTHPRWATTVRRGKWDIEFLVYDSSELERMSEGLVEALVAAAIEKNEIKDAMASGRSFSGKSLAEGVGRLLWRCPVCGEADAIVGRGDEIRCGRCGSGWELDANCGVRPLNAPLSLHAAEIRDLKDWNDWQVATLPELAASAGGRDRGLASEGVVLSRRSKDGLRRIGRGRLFWRARAQGAADEAELVFEAPEGSVAFEASSVSGFVDNFNSFSEFDHRGERWRVEFGGGNAAKWSYALARLSPGGIAGSAPRGDGAAA
jgi:1-acyl-sn-glycerol-3-phosphate acyltransferase